MDHSTTFTELTPTTYLHDPLTSKAAPSSPSHHQAPPNPRHPDTVILCAWPAAKPSHIARYTAGYAALYPTSRILLLLTPISTPSDDAAAYIPAATALLPAAYPLPVARALLTTTSMATPTSTPPRRNTGVATARRGVLLHLFSPAGAAAACALARAYRSLLGGDRPLDVQAVVFDAVPVAQEGWVAGAWGLLRRGWEGLWGERVQGPELVRSLGDNGLWRFGGRVCCVWPERCVMECLKAGEDSREWFVIREKVDEEVRLGGVGVDEQRYWGAIEELWV